MELLLPDGFGFAQLLLGYRHAQEVPRTGIALSYKKNLNRKVNYSRSAVAVRVIIIDFRPARKCLARQRWPNIAKRNLGRAGRSAGGPDPSAA